MPPRVTVLIFHPGKAVLESMLLDNKILDPTDRSAGYGFDLDVELQHSSIDTTKLSLDESALRVLEAIAPHSSED